MALLKTLKAMRPSQPGEVACGREVILFPMMSNHVSLVHALGSPLGTGPWIWFTCTMKDVILVHALMVAGNVPSMLLLGSCSWVIDCVPSAPSPHVTPLQLQGSAS